MDPQPIDAVFENGIFRPLHPHDLGVHDGDQVRLHIEQPVLRTSIDLGCAVFDGLSSAEIDEIERIALDRSRFFPVREIE
ncbi:MAG TPA: antitoxin family protein [Lacipirellulaceae bacterium]|jgi:predicted DNA-binding antitoxin AbrB/MazE fold protein